MESDADGQIKLAEYGNGVESAWSYDEMGRVGSVQTTSPYTDAVQTSNLVQNDVYDFDALGNLDYRHDFIQDFKEDFNYDTLNRLTKAEVSGAGASAYAVAGLDTITLTYDVLGNIKTKSDVTGASGEYLYGQVTSNAGPHAVSSIGGNKNTTFTYDNNGNQLSGNGRDEINYTSFNKPSRVQKVAEGIDIHMSYGPSRTLLVQAEMINGETTTTKYLGGLYEEVEKDGKTTVKHHLTVAGRAVAVLSFDKATTGAYAFESTHYLHRDHLNSIAAITDQQGKIVDRFHFDAFGKRRTAVQAPFMRQGYCQFPLSVSLVISS